jgi:hypothetical protein
LPFSRFCKAFDVLRTELPAIVTFALESEPFLDQFGPAAFEGRLLIASGSFMALNHSPVESQPELFSTAINGGSIASASFKRLLAGSDFDAPPVALSLRPKVRFALSVRFGSNDSGNPLSL